MKKRTTKSKKVKIRLHWFSPMFAHLQFDLTQVDKLGIDFGKCFQCCSAFLPPADWFQQVQSLDPAGFDLVGQN